MSTAAICRLTLGSLLPLLSLSQKGVRSCLIVEIRAHNLDLYYHCTVRRVNLFGSVVKRRALFGFSAGGEVSRDTILRRKGKFFDGPGQQLSFSELG